MSMDNYVLLTPTKRAGANGGLFSGISGGGPSVMSAPSPGRRLLLAGLPSPSVRRRPPSASAAPVKEEPPSPASPPAPPPSEATVRTVMCLQDSVASVLHRRQQRPPVYAAPQLPPVRSLTSARTAVKSKRLHDFWDYVGRARARGGHQTAALTEEQRRNLLYAVTSLEARLSRAAYPPPEVLSHVLRCCWGDDREVRRRCLRLMRQVTLLHPPHGRQMRQLYSDMLSGAEQDGSPLWSAVERCLSPDYATSPATREDDLLDAELLDVLVSLLEEDLSFWWRSNGRCRRPSIQLRDSPSAVPLLVAALWRQHEQLGSSVAATRRLCHWLVAAHRPAGPAMTVRRLMLRLTAMTAEITRIRGQRGLLDVTDNMQAQADDLARAVQQQHLDCDGLQELLVSLRPSWLAARLAADRLHRCYARRRLTGPLTLSGISTHYLSEKENQSPPPAAAAAVEPLVVNGAVVAASPSQKRPLLSPANSPAKRRSHNTRRNLEQETFEVAVSPAGSGSPDAASGREYSMLLYHLLCAHLLHTGLTEVRVRMTGRLLREAVAAGQPAAAAVTGPIAPSAPATATSTAETTTVTATPTSETAASAGSTQTVTTSASAPSSPVASTSEPTAPTPTSPVRAPAAPTSPVRAPAAPTSPVRAPVAPTSPVRAPAAPTSPVRAPVAPTASAPELLAYRRELEWIQDRLWRRGSAVQLDRQYELYMRTITKL